MARPKAGYRLADGTSVPGVTTIIGRFKDSGALLQWAFQQGRLAEQGVIRTLYERRDEAADAGTLAHEMVEAHIHRRVPADLLDGRASRHRAQGEHGVSGLPGMASAVPGRGLRDRGVARERTIRLRWHVQNSGRLVQYFYQRRDNIEGETDYQIPNIQQEWQSRWQPRLWNREARNSAT